MPQALTGFDLAFRHSNSFHTIERVCFMSMKTQGWRWSIGHGRKPIKPDYILKLFLFYFYLSSSIFLNLILFEFIIKLFIFVFGQALIKFNIYVDLIYFFIECQVINIML